MTQNKYDDPVFFDRYSQMTRSVMGLEGAGEWPALKALLPELRGKRVLDLGCGFGWHCVYAAQQGAAEVTGIDSSENMLAQARARTGAHPVTYRRVSIEDYEYPADRFDVVISSLALHYVADFDALCAKVRRCLTDSGEFLFSVEHPVFTAQGRQEWVRDAAGNPLHWPVDHYFTSGKRRAVFLGEDVDKYHRTLTDYVGGLLAHGFAITGLCEPMPPAALRDHPDMRDEMRRPMMLIVKARKDAG